MIGGSLVQMSLTAGLGLLVAVTALLGQLAGCGAAPAGRSRATAGTEAEPNDSFGQAMKTGLQVTGNAVLQGTIDSVDDLDVFSLGALAAGDQIIVDVVSLTSGFDSAIALFDENFNLFMDNDDQDTESRLFDPHLDEFIRHDGAPYYLVVGPSAFAAAGGETGDYQATVIVRPGGDAPPPSRQVLLLNFDGGLIEPDNLLTRWVEPFDAAEIARVYAGQDELIISAIVETIRENFAEWDVPIVTDADDLPAGEEYSTIMFGSRNRLAFGIAEAVDHYNHDHGDMAIIFTEAFDPGKFTETPSAQELGLAIGNIAAHETGHLLGLNHVTDPLALMDGASPADTFLQDQDFTVASLSRDILPIGYQDAVTLLAEIVGLLEGFPPPQRPIPTSRRGPRLKSPQATSWCGTCNRKLGR